MRTDLARQDEIPQKFTSAEMTEIKNAISQETVNVKIEAMKTYSPVEHQVGWWQEEVSGVLKQKPVYEKVVTGNFANNPNDYVYVQVGASIERVVGYNSVTRRPNDWWYNINSLTALGDWVVCCRVLVADNSDPIHPNCVVLQNKATQLYANRVDTMVQYTKTTDQWETVE